ncbi:MAG: MerR family transcriptional regulator [Deltaproteobacteria bacterium]|nr:MerR family transcriptional regulator [Deltaproteobacteria bacterium]
MTSEERVPDKLFFRIGEVSRIVGVKPYVLRYWEQEFSFIKPEKSNGKQRLYRRCDVIALCRIRRLLHEERYTIEGTRKKIREIMAAGQEEKVSPSAEICLRNLRNELQTIRSLIENHLQQE